MCKNGSTEIFSIEITDRDTVDWCVNIVLIALYGAAVSTVCVWGGGGCVQLCVVFYLLTADKHFISETRNMSVPVTGDATAI
jgi:hypothetical protein